MAQNNMLIIVGAIVIIACLVLAPIGIASLMDGLRDLFQDFRDAFLKDWGTKTSDNYAMLVMSIKYADGTEREFAPDTFSLLPLSISDDGGEVSSITFVSKAKLTMEGEINSWSADTELRTPIYNDQGTEVVSSVLAFVRYPKGTTWESGETKELDSNTISASDINKALALRGQSAGTYHLKATLTMSINAVFTDGAMDSIEGTTNIDWIFTYETGKIASLSLIIEYSSQH